jgi:DNA-binding transcriptional MerR regulator
MMQIGEIAKRTCLTVDAIRFYEKRKLLPMAVRTAGRFRLYGESSVERLRFIQQMQGLGFSLREVGELIQLRERKVEACESVRQLLTTRLAQVRAKMRELKRLERELESDFRKCSRELNHRQRHAACPCPVLEESNGGEAMKIEALYVAGCPNYDPAVERLQAVLESGSLQAEIRSVPVGSEEEGRVLVFPGAPTIRIDGEEVELHETVAPSLACRLYANRSGVPSEELLGIAISNAKRRE